jgi:hypothetical protein
MRWVLLLAPTRSQETSVVSVNDTRAAFVLGLRALELASERVKEACKGDDIDASAFEAHFGLHAVYDLHEAYFRTRGIKSGDGSGRGLCR